MTNNSSLTLNDGASLVLTGWSIVMVVLVWTVWTQHKGYKQWN